MANSVHTPEEPPPRQVSSEAIRFLAAIGREPPFLFRAIADAADKKGKHGYQPKELIGTFEEHAQQLRRMNDAGWGVFVQANAGDGKAGRADNITAATTFFADFDGVPLANVERLALAPHVTVETSPGKRHFYWRVDGIALDQFTSVQKRLIALFGSDKSVHDLPRIMRLPGFLHLKNPDAPQLVRVLEASDAAPYAFAHFIAALDASEKAHGIVPSAERKRLPAPSTAATAPALAKVARDLVVAESALRHSIDAGTLDLGDRDEWVKVGMALKASTGDAGFPLWVSLSSEAEGFEGEDDCRKQWDSFKEDRPAGERLTIATFIANAKYTGWKAPANADRGVDWQQPDGDPAPLGDESGGKGRSKPDDATTVIAQTREAGDEHFVDKDRIPHVRFRRRANDDTAPWIAARIDSEAYRDTLRRRFHHDSLTKTLSKEQLGNAIDLLSAEAREKREVRTVHLRSGIHAGKLYVDLGQGDGRVVEVDGDGWRVIGESPALFLEGPRGALPVPEEGGTLDMLADHMPSLDRWGVQRVLAFCIGVFNPNGARSMLLFTGPRGTNKSTLGDMTLSLIDPPAGRQDGRFSLSGDEQDLIIHATYNAVLSFDNLSSFSEREADWMCKLLTGSAFYKRKLYSNMEVQTFAIKRPIVGTGIGLPSNRDDFLDRLLPVETRVGGPRRTEEAVWDDFERDHAKLFGLVLTGVSQALGARSTAVTTKAGATSAVRLADVAAFVEGAHEVLELEPGAFTAGLHGEQGSLQGEAASGDPVGEALISYFSVPGNKPVECTGPELLAMLANGVRERDRGWPSKFKARSHLERIAGGLAECGIKVSFRKDAARNQWMVHVAPTAAFRLIALPASEHF